jgi:hypothetical protein
MHRRNLNPHGQWPRSSPPRAAPLRCPKDFLLSSKRDIIRIQTPAPSPSNPHTHGALYVVGGSSCLLFPDPRKHNYQGWCGIAATQPFFMSFAPSARDSHRGVVSPIFQRAANHHIPRQDPPISPTVHISINFIIQLFASNLKSRMLLSLKPPPFVPPSPAPAPP